MIEDISNEDRESINKCIDEIFRISASSNMGDISFSKVSSLLHKLRDELGYSYDK